MFTARNTAVLTGASGPVTYNQALTATCAATATLTAGLTGISAIAQSAAAVLTATFQKQVNKLLTAEA